MHVTDINTLPLIVQSKIIYDVGLQNLVKDPCMIQYIIDNDIVSCKKLVSLCVENNVPMSLAYILSKNKITLCFPGIELFIDHIAIMIMKDYIRCLRVYLWFFRVYACKYQKEVLDMVLQMAQKKYDKLLPELENEYDEYEDDDDNFELYIKKYHCHWEPNDTLSLRIQQFYNIWIRLFAKFKCVVHWDKIDFRLIMCRTSQMFSFLLRDKLIDKLILQNLEKLHSVDFDDEYLCDEVFNTFDRMGLDISMEMALGNFSAMCKHRKFLMNSNLDDIVIYKHYYRSTHLIKQYVLNRDYEAYERIVSMIDYSHKDLQDLFIDFIEKEGDLKMIEYTISTIQRKIFEIYSRYDD